MARVCVMIICRYQKHLLTLGTLTGIYGLCKRQAGVGIIDAYLLLIHQHWLIIKLQVVVGVCFSRITLSTGRLVFIRMLGHVHVVEAAVRRGRHRDGLVNVTERVVRNQVARLARVVAALLQALRKLTLIEFVYGRVVGQRSRHYQRVRWQEQRVWLILLKVVGHENAPPHVGLIEKVVRVIVLIV